MKTKLQPDVHRLPFNTNPEYLGEWLDDYMTRLIDAEELVAADGDFFDLDEASPTYIVSRAFTTSQKKKLKSWGVNHRDLVKQMRVWRDVFTSGP